VMADNEEVDEEKGRKKTEGEMVLMILSLAQSVPPSKAGNSWCSLLWRAPSLRWLAVPGFS
jgi:hypothetical protein